MQYQFTNSLDEQAACQHPKKPVVELSGRMTFSAGGIFDNITERIICPDCGADLTPAEAEIEYPF